MQINNIGLKLAQTRFPIIKVSSRPCLGHRALRPKYKQQYEACAVCVSVCKCCAWWRSVNLGTMTDHSKHEFHASSFPLRTANRRTPDNWARKITTVSEATRSLLLKDLTGSTFRFGFPTSLQSIGKHATSTPMRGQNSAIITVIVRNQSPGSEEWTE